jgi:hypothetical protein
MVYQGYRCGQELLGDLLGAFRVLRVIRLSLDFRVVAASRVITVLG